MDRDGLESSVAKRLSDPEFPDIHAAYLFGSEAGNRAHSESDVDLAVLLDYRRLPTPRERFDRRLLLFSRLAGLTAGRPLDLVVLNDLPPQFARRIVTEGRRVHCANPDATHAFVRQTLSRAADLEPFLRRMRQIKLKRLRTT
jgi:predicted nucleotidyltransferase